MASKKIKLYLSLDLEMLGLTDVTPVNGNSESGAKIYPVVQLSAIMYNTDFKEIFTYSSYVKKPESYRSQQSSVEFLRNHHFFKAYDAAVEHHLSSAQIDREVSGLIEEAVICTCLTKVVKRNQVQIILQGKSVYVDKQFLQFQFPLINKYLDHHLADVSAVNTLLAPLEVPGKLSNIYPTHDAFDDVTSAIADHNVFLKLMRKIPFPKDMTKYRTIEEMLDDIPDPE